MKTLRQIMTLLVMACIVFASSTAFAASLQDEVLNEVNLERTAAGIQPLSGIVYLLKLRTPETLMRQGFIRFSDIRHHHIMHTVSGTFPIDPAVLPRTDRAAG